MADRIGALLLILLMVVLTQATAERADARLVTLGESIWPGYGGSLRVDPDPPLCDRERAATTLGACSEAPPPPAAAPVDGDPFADPPAAAPVDDDPFADPPAAAPVDDDPFADPPAAAPVDDDPFADPPSGAAVAATVSCEAARQLVAQCDVEWAAYSSLSSRLTPAVRAFRTVDLLLQDLVRFAYGRHLLSLVLLLGGLQATWMGSHIRLRDPTRTSDHRFSEAAMLVAHLSLVWSSLADWRVQSGLGASSEEPLLPLFWAVGFGLLAAVNLARLARPPAGLGPGVSLTGALGATPLYAYMVVIGAVWFLLGEGHPSGQAIYLRRFAQFPNVYLSVALYVWAGMLLERTGLSRRVFDLLRPWSLPAPLLAFVVVVAAALPTAYSGASGIFVIAAGAVVFEEMRRAGGSREQALMVTAMSGSLGVVLRPCLIVVLVAALNKQVTTQQLYDKGFWVFGLTATLFLLAMLVAYRPSFRLAPAATALPAMGQAARRLLPDAAVVGAVILACWLLLDAPLNERSAPWILPIAILLVLVREHRSGLVKDAPRPLRQAFAGTREAGVHIGALLFLMLATVCLGGVIERAELMESLPTTFASPLAAMSMLVVAMVLVGMTMDPMGAVILVSVTLADVAYANGIDPVHFWMVVLVAFELGYLTPPVALNQLLARQVVGAAANPLPGEPEAQGWRRHEHIVLPVAVMGVALLIVAFGPLLLG